MKKCSSCTKDLPDAALHCVFCGAKQAAAAPPPSSAKTVMGYSANELIEQMKAAGTMPKNPPGAPIAIAPPNHPSNNPPPAPMPMAPPPAYPPASSFGGLAPGGTPASQAATMFVHNPPGQQMPMPQPAHAAQTLAAPPAHQPLAPAYAATLAAPPQHNPFPSMPAPQMQSGPMMASAPMAPVPMQQYNFGAPAAVGAGRPIEPWKESLRLMMFIWGGILLLAFVLPLRTGPLVFHWDAIIHAPGTAKVMPLLLGAAGLLSLAFAMIPTGTVPRGVVAMVVGLAGIVVPMVIRGLPPWQSISMYAGLAAIVAGLLIRSEYRDSILPRLMVTIGALAALAPLLVPQGEAGVPLVGMFKLMIAGGGIETMIFSLLALLWVALVLTTLLVWIPAPSSAGATALMWILLGFPVLEFILTVVFEGHFGRLLDSPSSLLGWAFGGGEHGGGNLPVAYAALFAYGTATTLGKTLE